MEWSRDRVVSLVVGGADVVIIIGAAVATRNPVPEVPIATVFLLLGLVCIWFPDKVAAVANAVRSVTVWPRWYDFSPGLVRFVGWGYIVAIVPVAAIVLAVDA